MDLKEILANVNRTKLKAALDADDPDVLKELLASEGVTLTDEQLDYVAGGVFGLNTLGSEQDDD